MAEPEVIPYLPLDIALDCLYRVPFNFFPTVRQVCSSWRTLFSSPSFSEARRTKGYQTHLACIVQAAPSTPGKSPVYSISAYDQKQNSWTVLPPIPDLSYGIPLFCSCVSLGSQIVVLGGWDPSSWTVLTYVYIYDFVQARWRRGASMPTARSFFGCAANEGRILVAGGHDSGKKALQSAEVYNIVTDAWEALPNMNQERDECKAVCLGGKFVVISGFSTDSQGQFASTAESFDFSKMEWRAEGSFWPAGRPPTSIVQFREQLYAILDGQLVRLRHAEKVWEPVCSLPAGVKAPACAVPLGDGILVVGFCGNGAITSVLWSVETPSSWKDLDASFGTVQHNACTVQV
ncbi:hypothetical protein KP509_19G006600 [Ceratopteris richardii]|uniref:F-box domain-containing protein n=1 Tax=Ceratopteris richardii TaxID=49495 RepID=A0A8T2SLA7_CERRI|nr:hypothetical protein KP509_19G006600 [Ceratopteris richardii]